MKKTLSMMAVATAMLAIASCNNDADILVPERQPASAGAGIGFTLTSETTRLHYAPNDWLQMEWDTDDKILIVCDQAIAPYDPDKTKATFKDPDNWYAQTSAPYKVTEIIANTWTYTDDSGSHDITTNSSAKIAVDSDDPTDALYWNEGEHTFYAGVGESMEFVTDEAGKYTGAVKCAYSVNQTLERASDGSWIDKSVLYMMAKKTTTPVVNLDLPFKPIMTTLEVEVQGTGVTGKDLTVVDMEVTLPKEQDVIVNDDPAKVHFVYDFNTGLAKKQGIGAATSKGRAETIVFKLKTPQTLPSNGTLRLTALLPPIALTSAYPVKITIAAEESANTMYLAKDVTSGSVKAVIRSDSWDLTPAPEVEGVDWVDLGQAGKWATCNLGAESPEQYGDYYGWGCTTPYATSQYLDTWNSYFQYLGLTGTGCSASTCDGPYDPLFYSQSIHGSPKYDPARIRLGGNWRRPTKTELQKLKDYCTWTQETVNGVLCCKVTSNDDASKFIYIPTAGYRQKGQLTDNKRSVYLTASEKSPNTKSRSYGLYKIGTGATTIAANAGNFDRCNGFVIRPIYVAVSTDPVDMGLDINFAPGNLGATIDNPAGDYYGWGCTEPYADGENVTWSLYFQKIGGSGSAASDCGTAKDPLRGVTEISGTQWDPVRQKMGAPWRMATKADWDKLKDESKFEWTWTTEGSVSGYKVTSKISGHTDQYIFLPAAGKRSGTSIADNGHVYWWSSTLSSSASQANNLNLHQYYKGWSTDDRFYGQSVRPVCD